MNVYSVLNDRSLMVTDDVEGLNEEHLLAGHDVPIGLMILILYSVMDIPDTAVGSDQANVTEENVVDVFLKFLGGPGLSDN